MMRTWLLALALAAGPLSDAAAQFTCTGPDGRKTFQDVPCPQGHQAEKLQLHQRNTIGPAADRPSHIREAIARRTVAIGMTTEELYRAFGQPSKVNASLYGTNRRDQLIYLKGADTWYVYTDNGVVSAVQHRPGSNFQPSAPVAAASPSRVCPSDLEIRNLEVAAGRMTITPEEREESQRQLRAARACVGERRAGMGGF